MDQAPPGPARVPALAIPVASGLILLSFLLLPPLRQDPVLSRTFGGVGLLLLLWTGLLFFRARETDRPLRVRLVVRRPHWIQLFAQGTVLLYWGWHVRSVYAFAPFILAQIVFAYGFDSLLSWSRRDEYWLGFGPVPVIFSISLFLWFELPWFYWQFAMVALVFVGKEFLRWTRDGRSVHIFNPSSFALAVASVFLLLTSSTDITLGLEIAQTQNNPPFIYAVIFLAALPGQILFGVATMTVTAVLTVYAFGLVYFGITGTYFFYDAFIPIAVFLGMHLLVTDPATSPRSERGRILFGFLYGVGILLFVLVLDAIDAPTFYDKLLPVPFLNLMVRRIDRWVEAGRVPVPTLPPFHLPLSPAAHRLAVVGVWVVVFSTLTAVNGLGDHHPGQYLPFWEQACRDGSARACDYRAVMEQNYCDRGSSWACNELGIHLADYRRNPQAALEEFDRACRSGFEPACANREALVGGGAPSWARSAPPLGELPIVLRGSKGPVRERSAGDLNALACAQGWPGTCEAPRAES